MTGSIESGEISSLLSCTSCEFSSPGPAAGGSWVISRLSFFAAMVAAMMTMRFKRIPSLGRMKSRKHKRMYECVFE